MTISATVVKDSISDGCPRITTFQLRYPRFIHAEVLTHRVFSRNSSSSRAIPVDKMIAEAIEEPAMPIYWGSNKAGMQAGEEIEDIEKAKRLWIDARDEAVINAQRMKELGLHKQVVNRVLEPYLHMNVVVTATSDGLDNFFALRDHPDAQPEIQILAAKMKEALDNSIPQMLKYDEWHLPYVDDIKVYGGLTVARVISVARCASVSYLTVDGKEMSIDRAMSIYSKLTSSVPFHASPFEHQARPRPDNDRSFCRNFTGWAQFRSTLEMS